ncbi:MAG: hypothetical protein GTO02_13725, partial [Candidatus Dadabacteria bacterium]|nr:hypothetical protein [Candidatus Dadabacteria bacterium]
MLVSELLKRPNKNILLENPTAKYLIDSNTRIGLEIELEDFNSIDYGLEDL